MKNIGIRKIGIRKYDIKNIEIKTFASENSPLKTSHQKRPFDAMNTFLSIALEKVLFTKIFPRLTEGGLT